MDRGELVPDDVTIGMLGERIAQPDAAGGFVLDGFPRTLEQATALDALLAGRGERLSAVLDLQVPADELVRRLSGRLVCRDGSHPYHVTDAPPAVPGVCDIDGSALYHRDDDDEDVVRKRVEIFEHETRPVRDHYRALGTPVVRVDGARGRDAVESDLVAAVRALEQS
jgi:adenylate kinase